MTLAASRQHGFQASRAVRHLQAPSTTLHSLGSGRMVAPASGLQTFGIGISSWAVCAAPLTSRKQQSAPRQRCVPACAAPPLASLAALSTQPGWDYICAVGAAAGAYIWVKIFDTLACAGALDQKLSRKLVHSTAGPLFMLMWPLFSSNPEARMIAAAVPCINLIRILLVGSGLVNDPALVKSTSRSGDKGELLRGPLYYVVVLIGATLAFWRESPAGLIAVSMMCGGDGLADIVGRRFGGQNRLPWNDTKSWAGSAAMLLGGAAMAIGFIWLFCSLGYFPCYPPSTLVPIVFTVCLVCTLIESLPINNWVDDNFSVPAAAIGVSMLLLPLAAAAAVGIAVEAAQGVPPRVPLLALAQALP